MIYRRRKTRSAASPIGPVLDRLLHQIRPGAGEAFNRIWDVWEEAVGPAVAAHARPAAFKNGVLVVHATNSVWLQQLQFLRHNICGKLNDHCGRTLVTEIKLKIGTR